MSVSVESAKSTLRAVLARGVAAALVGGIEQADQEGHRLTEVQKTDLATMALMAYRDAVVDGEESLDVEAKLHQVFLAGRESA